MCTNAFEMEHDLTPSDIASALSDQCLPSLGPLDRDKCKKVFAEVWGERDLSDAAFYRDPVDNNLLRRICESQGLVLQEAMAEKVATLVRKVRNNSGVVLLGETMTGKTSVLQVSGEDHWSHEIKTHFSIAVSGY